MAMTEAERAVGAGSRFKAAAPIAAGVGILASIVGLSVATAPSPRAPVSAPAATVAPPPVTPAQDPIPGLVLPQQGSTTSPAVQTGIEVVVKFKDDSRVKDIIDAFWRDQAAGKAKFEAWKASRPEFAKLKLDRVTYSNELVLVHDGSAPAAERVSAMRAIVTRLGQLADISYAEPNMTAHPGGQ